MRVRESHIRGEATCAYARDCSDECHRSISRRGWNFWPSREVREGDKGKRIRDRERKKGEREDRKIEGRRMYMHLYNASARLGGRRTNDHDSFLPSSRANAHFQRASMIGAASGQSVTGFPGS